MRADTPKKEVKSYDNQNRVQLQTQKIICNNKKDNHSPEVVA